MPDARADLRRHVRAAREWLGRAENSLAREDDIRGDLSLMLARAELSRAHERPTARQKEMRRILPLAVALLIAGGALLFSRSIAPAEPLPDAAFSGAAAMPREIEKAAEELPEPPKIQIELPTRPRLPDTPDAPESPEPPKTEIPPVRHPSEPVSRETDGNIVKGAPSPAMQKLMNSAAQKLRER